MKERKPRSKRARRGLKGRPHYARGATTETGLQFRVPPSMSMPKRLFVICHYCGFSPDDGVAVAPACPKCMGHSWERFALAEPLVPEHMKK